MREYISRQVQSLLEKAAETYDEHMTDNCVEQMLERAWYWDENEFDDLMAEITGALLAYLESMYGDYYDHEVWSDRNGVDYTIYIQWSRREPLDNPFTDCLEIVLPEFQHPSQ